MGNEQDSTSLGSPFFVQCWVMTKTFFTPATRSIAPPTAGIAFGFPVDQLARSPFWPTLHGTEHTEIEVTSADHRETVGMVEVCRAVIRRDLSLAGIDELWILFALVRRRRPFQAVRFRCGR